MNPRPPVSAAQAHPEIPALIETLRRTEQRLEELTAGQVDTVADRDGRAFLLRHAQEGSRDNEAARQAAILNALPAHIALLDAHGRIVSVNRAWSEFAGGNALRAPNAAVGHDYLAVCDQAVGEGAAEAVQSAAGIRSVLAGESKQFSLEYTCDSPSGQHWYRMTATPLRDDAAGGAVVMHVDTSDRRRAEAAVQQHAELLNAVASGTTDTVFVKDLQGRYLLCNEAFSRFVGRTVEQMVGSDNSALFRPGEARRLAEDDRRVFDLGQAHTSEAMLTGVDGTRTFLATKAPYRNADGVIIGLIGISRDITERKQADLERDQERQFLRTLLDALPLAVYTKDTAGRFVVCNRATLALFGFTHEQQMAGKTVFDVLPFEAASVVQADDQHVMNTQTTHTCEEEITDSDGATQTYVRIRVPLRDSAGQVTGLVGINRNITERKRAQQALQESQTLLAMAGRLAVVGGWSLDIPPTRLTWSAPVAAMHDETEGFSPSVEQAVAYYVPEHREALVAAFTRCISDGVPIDIALEIITANGRRRWVHAIGEAVRDEAGVVRRLQGALQDVSERKRAEQETLGLAARLTNTLESITGGFYIVDRDWRFTYVNAHAERMLGTPRAALIGQGVWDVFPPALGTLFEQKFRRAVADKVAVTFEAHYAPFGAWFRVSAYPSEEGLAVSFRDVTAERGERLQLELMEASVSQLNDIVMITDAALQNPAGPQIIFVNDAFVRMTGHAREDAIGKTLAMLHGPQTDRAELARIGAARARFEPVHTELVAYNRAGEAHWVEFDIVPVRTEGNVYSHFVHVARDISERKQNEDVLRRLNADLEGRVRERTAEVTQARDEAEQANRAKSAFLATMSHEIRTPMNGVIGMVDVLHQTSLKGYQVEMVDLIRDSAFSLLEIIEDILDFSKIEAGKLQIDCAPIDLSGVVEKVSAMLDHMALKAGIRLALFVDPRIPRTLSGDETRLRQVLVNLAANAIKFSSGRDQLGQVSVRVELVARAAQRVTVDLSVTDNGIGMDEPTVTRLFTPFTQADASTTRRFGGTGLGLAISSMLVNLMGGEIAVRSAPGQGSTFTVRLHFDALADAGTTIDPDGSAWAAGLRCRIVGTELPLADDLASHLVHAGVRVERAASLAVAAAMPQAAGLGLWLILPGPGVPAVAELRAMAPNAPVADTRFVVLGHGKRRRPRAEASDLVCVDADSMFRRTLFKTLAMAAGHAPVEAAKELQGHAPAPAPAPNYDQARLQRRLILVAEDNETNRKVIQQQLRLIGFAAEVVVNGREALQRWRSGDFALLLTDLHMPEMDGYALAVAVRAEEPRGQHTPIIALTANALRDEELRCQAVGMDAYLTKPVRLEQLRAAIEDWLGPLAQAKAERRATPGSVAADLSVLIALVGDDPAVISEVLQAFRSSAGQSGSAMRQGLNDGQLQSVADTAHTLKSGARSIGALRLGDICAQIELVAQSGRPEALNTLLQHFETELAAVQQFVDTR